MPTRGTMRSEFLDGKEKLPSHAYGGYEIHYVCEDGGILCHQCANGENGSRATAADLDPECPDDHQWIIVDSNSNWEDKNFHCDHCGRKILPEYQNDIPELTEDE